MPAGQAIQQHRLESPEESASGDRAGGGLAVEPQLGQRLGVVERLELKGSAPGGQVGHHEPVAVRGDFDFELIRLGRVDAVEDLAQGCLAVDVRSAGDDRRQVDLALGPVAKRVANVGKHGIAVNAAAVAQRVQIEIRGQLEEVPSVGRVGGHVDAVQAERGGRGAARNFLHLQVRGGQPGVIDEPKALSHGDRRDVHVGVVVDRRQDIVH